MDAMHFHFLNQPTKRDYIKRLTKIHVGFIYSIPWLMKASVPKLNFIFGVTVTEIIGNCYLLQYASMKQTIILDNIKLSINITWVTDNLCFRDGSWRRFIRAVCCIWSRIIKPLNNSTVLWIASSAAALSFTAVFCHYKIITAVVAEDTSTKSEKGTKQNEWFADINQLQFENQFWSRWQLSIVRVTELSSTEINPLTQQVHAN